MYKIHNNTEAHAGERKINMVVYIYFTKMSNLRSDNIQSHTCHIFKSWKI